jgi:hypothetical protein
MVSSRGLDAADLLLVNPLLDRRKTNAKLQGCVSQLEHFLRISGTAPGFALGVHENDIRPSA